MGGTYGAGANKTGFAIPYGAMVPKRLDTPMVEDMRLIATCLLTGHASGAALAVDGRAIHI